LGETIDENWGSKKGEVLNKILDAFQAKGGQLGSEG
jgi:hypothetical protein